jgi:hypothetical protein
MKRYEVSDGCLVMNYKEELQSLSNKSGEYLHMSMFFPFLPLQEKCRLLDENP